MALKKCKECKKEISTQAKRCPHCGAKAKTTLLEIGLALTILPFLIILIILIICACM